jgi:CubicO group peptidase (beta-lactamase class C family)
LDLEAPITRYLPDFTVHSAFESHPERRITLRMLLSHTAGFTHEAPVGNNDNLDPGSFEDHVRSISDTWLRFPVGTGYAYSNLGIDLAGHILERVEGTSFPALMRDVLLRPLGMDHSTFDRAAIRAADNRAVGHAPPYPAPPLVVPMTAAGGLYTSASDLARFLEFELNDGSVNGRPVVASRWMREMRTVPPPNPGADSGYALGVARTRWNRFNERPTLFDHGGGGYGFIADVWWAPQLQVGVAVLTSSQDHDLEGTLALSILGDLVTQPGIYRDRLRRLPQRPPVIDDARPFQPPGDLRTLVARAAMVPDGHEATRWSAYSGLYRAPTWNEVPLEGAPDRFFVAADRPYFDAQDDAGRLVRHALVEIRPGLFLADDGEMLDLTGQVPTWGNLGLVRVRGGPSRWQWAVLGCSALVAATWLLAAATRSLRRRRGRSATSRVPGAAKRWQRTAAVVVALTSTATLGAVAVLVAAPGLVDSGFLGRLDLPVAARLALHLPLVLTAFTCVTVPLVIWGWRARWWSWQVRLQYAAIAVAAPASAVQLGLWHLVGWGVS